MGRTEKEKMLAGDLYLGFHPELRAEHAEGKRLLRAYNGTDPLASGLRRAILEQLLGKVGEGVWIEPPFYCDYGSHIHLGDRVYMNFNCVILDCNLIEIGDDALFGPAVQIYAATHPLDPIERVKGPEMAYPVRIGAKTWIGGGAIILPGVTVGEGTTVGAGSVVTKDLPPYVFAAGNPCRVIRELQ